MSSESTVGITRITLQFSLNRSLNGAARDVQAAINAARADLPTSLRQNPSYYKVNPAAAPVARVPAIARDIEPDLCQHQRRCGQRHAANPTAVGHRGGYAAAHEERRRSCERGASWRRRGPQRGQQCARQ